MAMIPEGKPRDTLLKYDDPIESTLPSEKLDPKIISKGLPCTFLTMQICSFYEEENSAPSVRVQAY